MKPRLACLLGVIPFLICMACYALVFLQTEWASQNLILVGTVFVPAYSLISSRQIVCNFTEMDIDPLPKSFIWFTLFYFNRHAYEFIRKSIYAKFFLADFSFIRS